MVLLEAAVVVVVLGMLVYGTLMLWPRVHDDASAAATRGEWRATHYDAKGVTRVVLQKTRPGGACVLSEHVVATIPVDDPAYDEKILAAMGTARQRRAMFEAEQD